MSMKQIDLRVVALIFAFFVTLSVFVGCGQNSIAEPPETVANQVDLNTKRIELAEYIDGKISSDAYSCLAADSDIVVLLDESGATVSVRVILPQNIPFVADEFCEVLADASVELDVEIARLTVQSYSKNSSGEISSMVDWHTSNLETGIFTHEDDGFLSGGYTIEKLYEYFEIDEGSFIG